MQENENCLGSLPGWILRICPVGNHTKLCFLQKFTRNVISCWNSSELTFPVGVHPNFKLIDLVIPFTFQEFIRGLTNPGFFCRMHLYVYKVFLCYNSFSINFSCRNSAELICAAGIHWNMKLIWWLVILKTNQYCGSCNSYFSPGIYPELGSTASISENRLIFLQEFCAAC